MLKIRDNKVKKEKELKMVLPDVVIEKRTELQNFLQLSFITQDSYKPCRKCTHIFVQILYVYTLILIGLIVLFIVYSICGFLLLPVAFTFGYFSKYYNRHKESLRMFEEEAHVRELTLHKISVTNTEPNLSPVTTYVAECPCKNPKKTVLYIHGLHSGAYQFFDTLLTMRDTSDVHGYSITLPCWGISDTPKTSGMNIREITEWHGEVIAEVCTKLGLPSDLIVVSHSFGGMAAVNFAYSHPDKLSTLIMMACPGLLPTLGHNGWLWGVLFKLCIPEMLYNGYLGLLYCAPIYILSLYQKWNTLDVTEFWIRTRKELFGHYICSMYISQTPLRVYWMEHYLSKLARVKAKVGLIYMEEDTIIPPHQGGFIGPGLGIPYNVLKGRNHRDCEGLDAIAMVLFMIDTAKHVSPSGIAFADTVGKFKSKENPTSISPYVAGDMIQSFYKSVIEQYPLLYK